MRGLHQEAAATPMTAATPVTEAIWREAKGGEVISVGRNNQQTAIFPYSGPLAVWVQASQLLSLSLSTTSYSFLPTVSSPGVAVEVVAVLTVNSFRTRWMAKHHDTSKFLPEKFKGTVWPLSFCKP